MRRVEEGIEWDDMAQFRSSLKRLVFPLKLCPERETSAVQTVAPKRHKSVFFYEIIFEADISKTWMCCQ